MENSEQFFKFVSNPQIIEQLQRDLLELHRCMENKLWKASIILIGGLIEGIIYHYIEGNNEISSAIPGFSKRNIGLTDLLGWAREHNIIDENLFRLSEPIRDYRNLIHPRVQLRLGTEIKENLIQIAYNVFLEILWCVNKHHDATINQDITKIIGQLVMLICNKPASTADFQVYMPIIEKYGAVRGSKIVERSLRIGSVQNAK